MINNPVTWGWKQELTLFLGQAYTFWKVKFDHGSKKWNKCQHCALYKSDTETKEVLIIINLYCLTNNYKSICLTCPRIKNTNLQ